jgi:hypothetical protein
MPGRSLWQVLLRWFRTANVHIRRVKQGRPARSRLQAYLNHRNFQDAVRYTELPPTRFKNFWRE